VTCRKCGESVIDRDRACVACGAPLHVAEAFVEIISGALDGVGRSIPAGGLVIGRAPDRAAIVLPDPAVSRAHTRISCEGGVCYVEDLGSSSGTLVDGVNIKERVRARHGTVIEIGNTRIVCYLPNVASPTSPPSASQSAAK
jgi:pSer/pThr/pTyr-binding forkhead associated (FHA) protein